MYSKEGKKSHSIWALSWDLGMGLMGGLHCRDEEMPGHSCSRIWKEVMWPQNEADVLCVPCIQRGEAGNGEQAAELLAWICICVQAGCSEGEINPCLQDWAHLWSCQLHAGSHQLFAKHPAHGAVHPAAPQHFRLC